MARMKAIEAAVCVLEKEGVSVAFGVPGAAINPLYAAMKDHGGIAHILPELIDKLTPNGQAPQGGLGSGDDIVGMLGKMLQR